MAWNPNPTVTIAATNYTNTAFIGATVTYGRTQTSVQPRAGYATVSVADTIDAASTINIGDQLVITANNYTGTPVTLFTGAISDVVNTVVAYSPAGKYIRRDLIAVGPLALLNRRLAGSSGYPSAADGDRVESILLETYAEKWNQQGGTLRWDQVDPSTDWDQYGLGLIGNVDTPGLFNLAAYSAQTSNAYQLVTTAANSGLGVIYDTPANVINYDDADHRQTNALSNGYWVIPDQAIVSPGLTQSTRLGDVANTVSITYDGGTVAVTDTASETLYGPISRQYNTVLASYTQALEQANRYLDLVSEPNPQFDTLTLAVHQPDLTSTDVNTALNVYVGQPVQINDLPLAVGATFTGFVEGWTWRLGQKTADLKLTISDYANSAVAARWATLSNLLTWNTLDPTLDWTEIQ